MKKNITCIVCPTGCRMTAYIEDAKVTNVIGNTCKRGEEYAKDECISPKRVLTSTIKVNNKNKRCIVPVKTNGAIPKSMIFDAMEQINSVFIDGSISIGDVIIKDLFDTGVDVVATGSC